MTKADVERKLQEWGIEATETAIEVIAEKINSNNIDLESGLDVDWIAYLIS